MAESAGALHWPLSSSGLAFNFACMEKIPVFGDIKAAQDLKATPEALARIGKWIAAEDNVTKALEELSISRALAKIVGVLADAAAAPELISAAVLCIKLVASKQKGMFSADSCRKEEILGALSFPLSIYSIVSRLSTTPA